MIKIIREGIVFKSIKGTERQSCTFPDICILPSGRWLASCRAAPTKAGTKGQHVLVSFSDDEGNSWSEAYAPFRPKVVNSKYGLFRAAYLTSLGGTKVLATLCWVDHSNPELPFFNPETEGLLDTKIFLSVSEDSGETWSEPELIDTSPFNCPTPLTGPVLILPNGELACQFEINKPYYDTSIWHHRAIIMFSRDRGKTWPEYVVTAEDPENKIFYWDQRPAVINDGRILNFFWTYNYKESRYLNIHAKESKDNGKNWSEIWDTGVLGQPARPVFLLDSRVVMVYVDRFGIPSIKMRISSDEGKTFPAETENVIYQIKSSIQRKEHSTIQDTWADMENFFIGLPVTASLLDGDILVLFYAGYTTDITDVRWARIKVK
ncbi:MAG: glycoside hydrolase [Candidatus Omnitrophica bacterium]|nr:glycoside hydrolase [Candidatus Omnitrophota bacterium]